VLEMGSHSAKPWISPRIPVFASWSSIYVALVSKDRFVLLINCLMLARAERLLFQVGKQGTPLPPRFFRVRGRVQGFCEG
jgi:hypothetical protein